MNWFYFKFSVESSSFKLGKIYAYLWRLKQTSLSFVWFYQSVFLSKIVAFHARTVKRILTALMLSLLFRCFSLFLPHLRTLAQGKRSENCLRFGTGGPSLCLYPLLSRNILFFPALTMAAISVHNRDFEHVYVYWIWLCGSASYDQMMHHVYAMICLLFLSQNHVSTPIVSFLTDAQYSKHFQRSGKWSYVFLEWIATYINREGKTKINLFTSFFFWCILTLTLLHPFKSRIHFRREQYRNPVLNSANL